MMSLESGVNRAYAMIIQDESQKNACWRELRCCKSNGTFDFCAAEKDVTTMYLTKSSGPGQSSGLRGHQYQKNIVISAI